MSTELDVEFNLDETLTITASLKDPSGGALNLTGLTTTAIQWGISDSKGGTRLATLSIGSGITVDSAVAGTITARFAPSTQNDLHPGRYYHECQVTHGTHGVSIQVEGKVKIKESMFATEA